MYSQHWHAISVDDSFKAEPLAWLARNAPQNAPWLLAHADDGVIWGQRQDGGSFALSSQVKEFQQYSAIAVPLRAETLQQVRVFGPGGELWVWRTADGFAARVIEDGATTEADALLGQYLLWGRGRQDPAASQAGFTLLREGQQGPCHAPPIAQLPERRLALVVRHYLEFDEEDQARIAASRLVDLRPQEEE
jgi:CRISPR-associated protein (TIGR03984 family)